LGGSIPMVSSLIFGSSSLMHLPLADRPLATVEDQLFRGVPAARTLEGRPAVRRERAAVRSTGRLFRHRVTGESQQIASRHDS
jgi:hypothetical protein